MGSGEEEAGAGQTAAQGAQVGSGWANYVILFSLTVLVSRVEGTLEMQTQAFPKPEREMGQLGGEGWGSHSDKRHLRKETC